MGRNGREDIHGKVQERVKEGNYNNKGLCAKQCWEKVNKR